MIRDGYTYRSAMLCTAQGHYHKRHIIIVVCSSQLQMSPFLLTGLQEIIMVNRAGSAAARRLRELMVVSAEIIWNTYPQKKGEIRNILASLVLSFQLMWTF